MSASVTKRCCRSTTWRPARRAEFVIDGIPVAVVRIDDDVYAIGDICSHANVSLSEGEVWCDEKEIECPSTAARSASSPANPSTLPATQPVPVFEAAWSTARSS